MDTTGYTFELSSRYEGWWRYNAALMCGLFDHEEQRIGFASAESHIADVGSNLATCPEPAAAHHVTTLQTAACDHAVLYIYIIPHTLPTDKRIESILPFEVELKTKLNGKSLRTQRFEINQWSGASIELKIKD